MALHIAVAGKGGTGKTTLCSLIIRQLVKSGKRPTLAVDADANANLNEALGLEIEGTIAETLARLYNSTKPLPAGMTKDIKKMYLVITRVTENTVNILETEIKRTGLELIGTIPADAQVMELDLLSKPLIDLPDNSPVVLAVHEILEKALIL